ncbi:unnamed protein product [Pleuronectes platessa]|uniref:Uncharacterized protein n=1 Tax=Pleuronectes platessa TaxID=8262 RepID=A0A9N7U3C0_PLEPL|nr:unnamed protein product [Pleuronectes platessa]
MASFGPLSLSLRHGVRLVPEQDVSVEQVLLAVGEQVGQHAAGPTGVTVAAGGEEAVPPELSEAGGSAPAVGAAGGPVDESAAVGGSVIQVSTAGQVSTEDIMVVTGVKGSTVVGDEGGSGPVPGGSMVGDDSDRQPCC